MAYNEKNRILGKRNIHVMSSPRTSRQYRCSESCSSSHFALAEITWAIMREYTFNDVEETVAIQTLLFFLLFERSKVMAETQKSMQVRINADEVREQLLPILMAQYQDGLRDGAKIVRDVVRRLSNPDVGLVLETIDSVIRTAEEEAAKASQKIHGL